MRPRRPVIDRSGAGSVSYLYECNGMQLVMWTKVEVASVIYRAVECRMVGEGYSIQGKGAGGRAG